MQRTLILALLVASAPAFAHDVDPCGFEQQHSNASSSLSRSQVVSQMRTPLPLSIKIDDQGRAITAPSIKSRAQVVAETNEAARLGLLRVNEIGPVAATAEQEQRIRQAGLQAAGHSVDVQ